MPAVLIIAIAAALLIVVAIYFTRRQNTLRRETFIRSVVLPRGLFAKLRDQHPALTPKDCQLVAQGLRQFFLAYLQGGKQSVSMPSQVVDTLWHEFILHTREYQRFCTSAFGQFLHHSPAVAIGSVRLSNEGLRRVWWHACKQENINPRNAARLPLLFALDAKLKIANGFHYAPDCSGLRRQNVGGSDTVIYCGGEFSDSRVDGSIDGFGDGGGLSTDTGGDAGGGSSDGGGGCGGGGCSS